MERLVRHRRAASFLDLPPHVLANVSQWALVMDVVHVAHTCRRLHQLITSHETCRCACAESWSGDYAGAFWTHWRSVARISRLEFRTYVRFNMVVCVDYALRAGGRQLYVEAPADERPHSANDDFVCAASGGHTAVVRRLLDLAPRRSRAEAFIDASGRGHLPVVDLLLTEAHEDVSGQVMTHAVSHAFLSECAPVIERLLPLQGRADSEDWSQLFDTACVTDQVAIVDRLLRSDLVDLCDVYGAKGRRALTKAAKRGCVAVVKRLLAEERTDPNDACLSSRPWTASDATRATFRLVWNDSRLDKQAHWLWLAETAARLELHDVLETLLREPVAPEPQPFGPRWRTKLAYWGDSVHIALALARLERSNGAC